MSRRAAPVAGPPAGRVARRYRLLGTVATLVVVADLVTKAVVEATIPPHRAFPVIDGFLSLVHVRNTGAAFGLLASAPAALRLPFFLLVSLGAVAVVVVFVRRLDDRQWGLTTALALVLGGAIGNLVDRVRYGEVVDFVLVYWRDWHWPAFNVADSAISIGVAVLVWSMTFGRRGPDAARLARARREPPKPPDAGRPGPTQPEPSGPHGRV